MNKTNEPTLMSMVELVLKDSGEKNTEMKPSWSHKLKALDIPTITAANNKKALADKAWSEIIQEFLNFSEIMEETLWPSRNKGGVPVRDTVTNITTDASDVPENPKTAAEKAAALMGTSIRKTIGNAVRLEGNQALLFKVKGTEMFIANQPSDFLKGEATPEKDIKAISTREIDCDLTKWKSSLIKSYIQDVYSFMAELKEWAEDPKKQSPLIVKAIKEANDNIILIIEEEI